MSSSKGITRRGILTLGGALLVSACGFRPAYGPAGAASGLYGAVRADDPTDTAGFDFVDRFEERLGTSSNPRYGLSYQIVTNRRGVAGPIGSITTRYHLTGRIDYILRDLSTGQILHRGTDSTFAAFSAEGTTVSEREAELDAGRRLMTQLADQVIAQLVGTYGTWAP